MVEIIIVLAMLLVVSVSANLWLVNATEKLDATNEELMEENEQLREENAGLREAWAKQRTQIDFLMGGGA